MHIKETLQTAGYINSVKIAQTLQGEIWRSQQQSSNQSVVIKVAKRHLHKQRIAIIDGKEYLVHENIKKETTILQKLSQDERCPNSIIKYIDSFKSNGYYFLVMEDGGRSLFDFILKAHRCVDHGKVTIAEWHTLCKIIFKQMIQCIQYLHQNNICHLDISLENFLINDVEVRLQSNGKLSFVTDNIRIKLCDFGLAEIFPDAQFGTNKYCGKLNYKSPEVVSKNDTFCAKSNDTWCLGVSLFMMIIGAAPWKSASNRDSRFIQIMSGDIVSLLVSWDRLRFIDSNIIDLFTLFFQYEKKRISIDALKHCKWLQDL